MPENHPLGLCGNVSCQLVFRSTSCVIAGPVYREKDSSRDKLLSLCIRLSPEAGLCNRGLTEEVK